MKKNYFYIFPLILLINNCSYNDDVSCNKKNWQLQKQDLLQQQKWTAKGKIKLKTKDKSYMGSFSWQQNYNSFSLNITGPLGIGIAEIKGNNKNANIYFNQQEKNISLKYFMQTELGHYIEPKQLANTLIGMPQTKNTLFRITYPFKESNNDFATTWEKYSCFKDIFRPQKVHIQLKDQKDILIFINQWQLN